MTDPMCSCGKQRLDERGRCAVCGGHPHPTRRHHYQLPHRPAATPPPSHPPSPRASLEHAAAPRPSTRVRDSSLSAAITRAFASEADDPVDLFPASSYRSSSLPGRSTPRSSMSPTPVEHAASAAIKPTPGLSGPVAGRPSRQLTPEAGGRAGSSPGGPGRGSIERAYSPMAAGFARLSRKEAYGTVPGHAERRARGSLDLEARMFEGAA